MRFHSASVPTGAYFRLILDELGEINRLRNPQENAVKRLSELCFVGVFSYFEAFCKDHFASVINILPSLIERLDRAKLTIDATRLLRALDNLEFAIGFYIADNFNFGSAQKINSNFNHLLLITPFSKDESARYSRLLNTRNLLVHHGGVFTDAYIRQAGTQELKSPARPFVDSALILPDDVTSLIEFIASIAKKMLVASKNAMTKIVEQADLYELPSLRKEAIRNIDLSFDVF